MYQAKASGRNSLRFYAMDGAALTEVAIKLALQYQVARGQTGRTRLLTTRGGYHGDTFAPMSICDPVADQRGDADYKRAMCGEMTRRALQAALARTLKP